MNIYQLYIYNHKFLSTHKTSWYNEKEFSAIIYQVTLKEIEMPIKITGKTRLKQIVQTINAVDKNNVF